MKEREPVEIEVLIAASNGNDILVKDSEDSKGTWLPRRLTRIIGHSRHSKVTTIKIPTWLAIEHNLV